MSMFQLISDAKEMLLDRSSEERELINYVASLDHEERGAIIFAYRLIKDEEK